MLMLPVAELNASTFPILCSYVAILAGPLDQ
jgi:hypothetical protein